MNDVNRLTLACEKLAEVHDLYVAEENPGRFRGLKPNRTKTYDKYVFELKKFK